MNSQPSNFTDTAFAWNEDFISAHHTLQKNSSNNERQSLCLRLIETALTQNPHSRKIAQEVFELEDILALRSRMIGNGLIGEKSAGIVMAEAILQKHHTTIAPLRPFFITTDVFQHYCNENGFSPTIQPNAENLPAPDPQSGVVPGNVASLLHRILEELQGSPIVLASGQYHADSSLFLSALNSIAFILPGPIEEQTEIVLQSIQRHYARHLSQQPPSTDEQPTLLLYALPGVRDGDWFYPHLTGRGYSYSPYRWTPSLNPRQGAVRFLVGLGRENADEFTRLLNLSDPALRPESTQEEMKRFSQKKVQLLDLKNREPRSIAFEDLIRTSPSFPSRFFVEQENLFSHLSRETESTLQDGVFLAYNKAFRETTLLKEIEDILHTLAHRYEQECQVDFAVNFQANTHTISLLACKPGNLIQASSQEVKQTESLFIQAHGSVIGDRDTAEVDRIIYVKPPVYGHMPNQDQYSIARLIGRLTRLQEEPPRSILLLGPGRWGTTTPSLGVPVAFAEIKNVSVLGEIISMREDLIPDVSQGTHFFSEMVDTGILYFAFSPFEKTTLFHERHIESLPNQLTEFIPSAHRFEDCIHVVDLPVKIKLCFQADIVRQSITGRLDPVEEKETT